MNSSLIVKMEIGGQAIDCLPHIPVISQVNLFVLDCPPEPLDEDIVQSASAAIHTDENASVQQPIREIGTGKLSPLVRIENFRLRPLQSAVQRREAKA